ncbi:hypothetical protein [Criblamydia sequanensis]|uniref:TPR repeat-containing protein n=1 Tax=Candidatus Criblamydia sequanensis CRIB-18 TaxID=1437425 RepID=A0A090DV69_9BACT|nr:hypothetical protein [Criblamydia sequanensis]CDR32904.1 hypothetical protein CSEC_0060 [Criblamydia sequanensis CRIB-18]
MNTDRSYFSPPRTSYESQSSGNNPNDDHFDHLLQSDAQEESVTNQTADYPPVSFQEYSLGPVIEQEIEYSEEDFNSCLNQGFYQKAASFLKTLSEQSNESFPLYLNIFKEFLKTKCSDLINLFKNKKFDELEAIIKGLSIECWETLDISLMPYAEGYQALLVQAKKLTNYDKWLERYPKSIFFFYKASRLDFHKKDFESYLLKSNKFLEAHDPSREDPIQIYKGCLQHIYYCKFYALTHINADKEIVKSEFEKIAGLWADKGDLYFNYLKFLATDPSQEVQFLFILKAAFERTENFSRFFYFLAKNLYKKKKYETINKIFSSIKELSLQIEPLYFYKFNYLLFKANQLLLNNCESFFKSAFETLHDEKLKTIFRAGFYRFQNNFEALLQCLDSLDDSLPNNCLRNSIKAEIFLYRGHLEEGFLALAPIAKEHPEAPFDRDLFTLLCFSTHRYQYAEINRGSNKNNSFLDVLFRRFSSLSRGGYKPSAKTFANLNTLLSIEDSDFCLLAYLLFLESYSYRFGAKREEAVSISEKLIEGDKTNSFYRILSLRTLPDESIGQAIDELLLNGSNLNYFIPKELSRLYDTNKAAYNPCLKAAFIKLYLAATSLYYKEAILEDCLETYKTYFLEITDNFSHVFLVPVPINEREDKDQFHIKRYLFLLLELSKTFLAKKSFKESAELMPKEDLYLKLLSSKAKDHERESVKSFIASITSSRVSHILSFKEKLSCTVRKTGSLIRSLISQSKYEEALKLSEQCPLSNEIPEESALILREKAIAEKGLRKLPQALESIKKAIRLFPNLPGFLLGAEIALLNKEYSLALSYYENCFPGDGPIHEAKHYLGRAKAKIGANHADPSILLDLSTFINQINSSQVQESQQIEAHELFFSNYLKLQGEAPAAIEIISKILPKSSTILYLRARYYQSKGRYDKAIEDVLAYEKLMDGNGDFAAKETPLVTLHITEVYFFANICQGRSQADYVSKIRSHVEQHPKFFNLCYQLQFYSTKEDPERIKMILDLITKHYPEKTKNPRFSEAITIHRAKALFFEGDLSFAAHAIEPLIRIKFPSPVVAILLVLTKRVKEAEALVLSFPEGPSKKIISFWSNLDSVQSTLDKQKLSASYEAEVFKTNELLYALSYLHFLKELDFLESIFPFIQRFCKSCGFLQPSLAILAAGIISAQNRHLSLFILDLGLNHSEKKFKIFELYIETLKSIIEKEGDSAELNTHFAKLFSFRTGFPYENIDTNRTQSMLKKLFKRSDASILELYNERLKGLGSIQSPGTKLQPIELALPISKPVSYVRTIVPQITKAQAPILPKPKDGNQPISKVAASSSLLQALPLYAPAVNQKITANPIPPKQVTPPKALNEPLQASLQNIAMAQRAATAPKPKAALALNQQVTQFPRPVPQVTKPIPYLPLMLPVPRIYPLLQIKPPPQLNQSQSPTIGQTAQALPHSSNQTYPLLQRTVPLGAQVVGQTLPISQSSSLKQKRVFQSERETIRKLAQPVPQQFFSIPPMTHAAYPLQAQKTQGLTPLLFTRTEPRPSQLPAQSIGHAYLEKRSLDVASKSQAYAVPTAQEVNDREKPSDPSHNLHESDVQAVNEEFPRESPLEISTLSHERENQRNTHLENIPKSKKIRTSSNDAAQESVETLENEITASSILEEQGRVALLKEFEKAPESCPIELSRKRKLESEIPLKPALGEYLKHFEDQNFLDDLLKKIEEDAPASAIVEASPLATYDLNQEVSYVYDLISKIDNRGLFLGDLVDYRLKEYLESQMMGNFPVVFISRVENSDFIFKGNSEACLLFEYLINDPRKVIYFAPKSSLSEVILKFKKIILDKKINLIKERLKNIKKNLERNYLRNNVKLMQTLLFLIKKAKESAPSENDFKASLLSLETELQELDRKGSINLSSTFNNLENCPHIKAKLNSSFFTFLASPVSSLISQDLKVGKLIVLAAEDEKTGIESKLQLSSLEVSTIFYPPRDLDERFRIDALPLMIVDMDEDRLSNSLSKLWNFLPSTDPALRSRSRIAFHTLRKKIETILQNPISTDQKLLENEFEALKAYFSILVEFANKLRSSHCSINLSKSFFDTYIKYDNNKIDKKQAVALFRRFLEEYATNRSSISFWRDKFEKEVRSGLDETERSSRPLTDFTPPIPIMSQEPLLEERLRRRKERETELEEKKICEAQELAAFKEFMSESELSGNLEAISFNSITNPHEAGGATFFIEESQKLVKINRTSKIPPLLQKKMLKRAFNWTKMYPVESIRYKKTWRKEEAAFEMPDATHAEKNLHLLRTKLFYLNMQYTASVEIRNARLELYKKCDEWLKTSSSQLNENAKSALIALFYNRKRTMPFGFAQERDRKYAELQKYPSKLSDEKIKEKVLSIHEHYLYYKDYANNLGRGVSQGMDLVIKSYAKILEEKLATPSLNVFSDFESSSGAFKLLNEFNDCLTSHHNWLKFNSINDSKTKIYHETVYNLKKDFCRIKEAFLNHCFLELNQKNLELIEHGRNGKDKTSTVSLKNKFYLNCQKIFDEFYSLEQWALSNLTQPEGKVKELRNQNREISKLVAHFYSNFSPLLASETGKRSDLKINFKLYLMKELRIAITKKMEHLKTYNEITLTNPYNIVSASQGDLAKSHLISLQKELQYFHDGLLKEAQGNEKLAKTLNEFREFIQTNFKIITQDD